ncbi:unnamed protein product, partial [Allacma fusca]
MEVRWNTTYYMLTRLVEMRPAFEHILANEPQLASFKVSQAEWILISEMIKLLEPFWKMTVYLSKAKVPSMALSAAVYIELYNHLEGYTKEMGHRDEICAAAAAACSKLNKYYPTSDGLVYIMGLLLGANGINQSAFPLPLQNKTKLWHYNSGISTTSH